MHGSAILLDKQRLLAKVHVYYVCANIAPVCLARKDENVYKFKGFDSARCSDSMQSLEQLVNAWMEAEHPRIRHMCQSMRGDHILLSFVYEETRELEQRISAQTQTSSALPRYFEEDFIDDRPTGGRIPATPPPMH
jgi:hypothetical protein